MTDAEKWLWQHLRQEIRISGSHFRRQVAIGPYVVDFCSFGHRLIVEVDGPIHRFSEDYDRAREAALSAGGYRVLRFRNDEIMLEMKSVLERVRRALAVSTPTPSPSPQGGGEFVVETA